MSIPFDEWPELMTCPDVIRCLDIPPQHAYSLFRRPDFPILIPEAKRSRTISKYALQEYLKRPRR